MYRNMTSNLKVYKSTIPDLSENKKRWGLGFCCLGLGCFFKGTQVGSFEGPDIILPFLEVAKVML